MKGKLKLGIITGVCIIIASGVIFAITTFAKSDSNKNNNLHNADMPTLIDLYNNDRGTFIELYGDNVSVGMLGEDYSSEDELTEAERELRQALIQEYLKLKADEGSD